MTVGVLGRLRGDTPITETPTGRVDELSEQLRAEQDTNLVLKESIADLELAMEDVGWARLAWQGNVEFTRPGMRRMSALCSLFAISNPLIKRGLALRTFYVWGLGVAVTARAQANNLKNTAEQDVNAVAQAFLDDPLNRACLSGEEAREYLERGLGTDGNLFPVLFTNPATGAVQVVMMPFDEVDDVITNPDNRAEPWFYKRCWTATVIDPVTTMADPVSQTAYYPALGYRPARRIKSIDGHPVHWDAPVRAVKVNAPVTWKFGVPDAYAAIDWARAYKDFLEDWAKLVKALSKFAYQLSVDGNRAKRRQAAAKLSEAPSVNRVTGEPNDAGATMVATGAKLEAVSKSGATIDSDSGKPLAGMVAAALDVAVTMLLADPGVTGARATAETLDRPTELMAGMRRGVWTAMLRDILDYVVDQAVKAPRGLLKGSVRRDPYTDTEIITLAGDTDRTIDIDWPPLDELPMDSVMKALQVADQIGKTPPLVIARLVLRALGVEDVDEILDDLTDEQGNFVDPDANAGQAAVDAFRRGTDPASDAVVDPAPVA